jgi:hypothetical protein
MRNRSISFRGYFRLLIFSLVIQLFSISSGQDLNGQQKNSVPEKGKDLKKPAKNLEEVIIVYKTHFDIGYSGLARDVVHNYRTRMVDDALSAVEFNRTRPEEEQFVWTVAGWPMSQILWQGQSPERRAAVGRAVREKKLVVHAFPFTTHTETLEPEDLVRGLGFSSRINREYGLPLPGDAKMTDVPSHSWILPTLLTHAGINFIQIGGGLVNRGPEIPMLFWWEGPDSSKLLTLYINAYGTTRTPPADWPARTWLYLSMTGDNQGPPKPETVREDVEFYKKYFPGVKIRIGQLSDFSDRIISEDPTIPTIRGDMPDTWVHGVMSSPVGTMLSRNTRPLIQTAEVLNTLEKTWGIYVPDISPAISEAYEKSLLYGEHTWGLAAQHYRVFPYGKKWEEMLARGLPANFMALEEAWNEHEKYIRAADELITGILPDHVSGLADNVGIDRRRIVVYNPLPWKRDGMVTVNICYWGGNIKAVKPTDSDQTEPAIQIGPSSEGEAFNIIKFMAKDIPPTGYRTYTLVEESVTLSGELITSTKDKTIENRWFRVKFNDQSGVISSILDKRSMRELVDTSSKYGFGQYFYERFGKAEVNRYLDDYLFSQYVSHKNIFDKRDVPDTSVYRSATCKGMNLIITRNDLEVSGTMTGGFPGPGMPQSTSVKLTLYKDKPVIDLEVGVEKKPDGWPEAGWICLPFNIKNPSFRVGRNGSVIDPVKDIINGCNFRQLYTYSGTAVFNENGGIGFCPMDSPLLSLGEPGGRKYNTRYEPDVASVFVNLYNNQWATNFREWWGGRITSRVRIWTFDKYDNESTLYTPAMEARVPLLAARSEAKSGSLPASSAGIVLSRKGILITAFGKNPDGDGIILRLWEQTGRSGPCTVALPEGMKVNSVQPVDLRGSVAGDLLRVVNGRFTFALKGYEPATFLIKN